MKIAPATKRLTVIFFLLNCLAALPGLCKAQSKEKVLNELNELLINTVMDDVFTPPVASRIYAYPNIAFYECIRNEDPDYKTLVGKLNGLKFLPLPRDKVDNFISAAIAFSSAGQSLVGSEYRVENWRKKFVDSFC